MSKKRVAVLSYFPGSRGREHKGASARDVGHIRRAGGDVVLLSPPQMDWRVNDGPVIVGENVGLLYEFLKGKPEFADRFVVDFLQITMKGGQDALFNAVHARKGGSPDTLGAMLECPHRPAVVRKILTEVTPYMCLVAAPLIYPRSWDPANLRSLPYRETFPEALKELGIETCPGCIRTASEMLRALVARTLNQASYDPVRVWEEAVAHANRPEPTRYTTGMFM